MTNRLPPQAPRAHDIARMQSDLGWTREQVAEACGTTPAQIGKWIAGQEEVEVFLTGLYIAHSKWLDSQNVEPEPQEVIESREAIQRRLSTG